MECISNNKFYCEKCNVKCSKMSDWNRHISTAKHANLEGFRRQNYACFKCNFTCDHKSSWDKHITTQKHRRNISAEKLGYEITPQHIC
jgi:hypothetical protein